MKLKLKHFAKRLMISMIRSRQRRALEITLMQLTDRELADIGINRCDIPRVAAEANK
jgi:uncharacterized protein YjiS (DUF1127 family)